MVFTSLHSFYALFPFLHPYFYSTSLAFLTWFPAFPPPYSCPDSLHSPYTHPGSPHTHPYSPHSHPDSLNSHPISPIPNFHSVIRFLIPAFTDGCKNRSFNEFENTFNQLQKQYQPEWVVTSLKNTQEGVQF